jgi:Superinfection immunity protein
MYFVPAFIAFVRKHRNTGPICILNLLLGWTFLGWVAALVWSFTDNTR